MRKLKRNQLVEVVFYDHAADASWLSDESKAKCTPPVCNLVGRVCKQDKVALYLSHFNGFDGKKIESDLDTVIIGAIIEIWELAPIGKQPILTKQPLAVTGG